MCWPFTVKAILGNGIHHPSFMYSITFLILLSIILDFPAKHSHLTKAGNLCPSFFVHYISLELLTWLLWPRTPESALLEWEIFDMYLKKTFIGSTATHKKMQCVRVCVCYMANCKGAQMWKQTGLNRWIIKLVLVVSSGELESWFGIQEGYRLSSCLVLRRDPSGQSTV